MEGDYERTKGLLKEKILQKLPETGRFETPVPGLGLFRKDTIHESEKCFYSPLIVAVIQGEKRSIIVNREYRYGEDDCLVSGMDLPAVTTLTKASAKKPFLSLSLKLDRLLAAQVLAEKSGNEKIIEEKSGAEDDDTRPAISVAKLDENMLDVFLRLTNLIDTPEEIPILAPLYIREIHYRMLAGPHSRVLRSVSIAGTRSNRIADAVAYLRQHYNMPFRVETLAGKVNMSVTNFNRYFRQVTSLSPLQFQKRLRLCEAQRLMVAENKDATQAAYAVGYESVTQFNREYKRLFSEPPLRDVNKKRVTV